MAIKNLTSPIYFMLILCPLVVFGKDLATENASIKIEVNAKLYERNDEIWANLQLKNTSAKVIRTFENSTPWAGPYATTWVLVSPKNPQDPLPRRPALADFPPNYVNISPGAQISGNVNLTNIFPSIKNRRADGDLLVFWAYRLRDIDGNYSVRTGGMLVIASKKDP